MIARTTMDDLLHIRGFAKTEVRHEVAHDQWANLYQQEASLLIKALGDALVDIQHVGSTAVPVLIAKPILDGIVAVNAVDRVPEWELSLAKAWWVRRAQGDTDGRLYFVKGPPEWRTGHLSMVVAGSPEWDDQVRFRDILRTRPDVAARYTEFKLDLALRFPRDRKAYTLGKADFIQAVLANIRAG